MINYFTGQLRIRQTRSRQYLSCPLMPTRWFK